MFTLSGQTASFGPQLVAGTTSPPVIGYLVGGYVRTDTPGTLLSAVLLTFSWNDGTGAKTQQVSASLNVSGLVTQIPPFSAVLDGAPSNLTVSGVVVSTGATFTVFVNYVQG